MWPLQGLLLVADKYMINLNAHFAFDSLLYVFRIASAFTVKNMKYIADLRSPDILYGKILVIECMTKQSVLCHSVFLFPGIMVIMKYSLASRPLKRKIPQPQSHGSFPSVLPFTICV